MKNEKYLYLPEEMKRMRRFVGWKKGTRKDKNGNTVITKLPYSLVDKSSRNWNAVEKWISFEEAGIKEMNLGFVLAKGDNITAIDLDNCFCGKELKPFAKDVVERFRGSYTELSQSGQGIHIFAKGTVPGNIINHKLGIEIYTERHYIALTGNAISEVFQTSNRLLDKQDELLELYGGPVSGPPLKKKCYRDIPPVSISYSGNTLPPADEILSTMARTNMKARTLVNGGTLTGDRSRDDYIFLSILRNYTHGNAELMKEIFLRTPLNRMSTGEKRTSEIGYLKYLEGSIRKVLEMSYIPFDWSPHNAFVERQKRKKVMSYERI